MRRSCALLAALPLLLGSPLASTAHARTGDTPAQAAVAVKGEFAKKSSVLFSQIVRQGTTSSGVVTVGHGKHRFAAGTGVHASDVTRTTTVADMSPVPFRMVNIGRDSYTQSGWDDLPKGKKWSHWRNRGGFLWSQNLVDALNPKFLQLISAGAKKVPTTDRYDGVRTSRYDGTVEVGSIGRRAAGTYYSVRKDWWDGGRIKWKLWLGPDNLPRRFQAEIMYEPYGEEQKADAMRMNVLYKGWGTPVRITAPPRRLVVGAE